MCSGKPLNDSQHASKCAKDTGIVDDGSEYMISFNKNVTEDKFQTNLYRIFNRTCDTI